VGLAEVFAQPDVAYLAPQAPDGSWYPYSFLAPIDQNEPQLLRALAELSKSL
jgi:phospholipase/carboxylesterase